jgi:class 3 adenylate cyclase
MPLGAQAPEALRRGAPQQSLPRRNPLPSIVVRQGKEMPLAREQRRLAAIVAIDVVGYSRLMGLDESGTHALLKRHLAERVGPSIAHHGGRVVKLTGDGVLAEFGSAVDALSATIELQQGMASATQTATSPKQTELYSALVSILVR